MKKCRITVMKVIEHTDLMERYENPMLHACDLREGQVLVSYTHLSWRRIFEVIAGSTSFPDSI